jgi:hypothetical protein
LTQLQSKSDDIREDRIVGFAEFVRVVDAEQMPNGGPAVFEEQINSFEGLHER